MSECEQNKMKNSRRTIETFKRYKYYFFYKEMNLQYYDARYEKHTRFEELGARRHSMLQPCGHTTQQHQGETEFQSAHHHYRNHERFDASKIE